MQNQENEKIVIEKTKKKPSKYFVNLRRSVDRLMDEQDFSVKDLIRMSDLSPTAINSFLYDMDLLDCKLSTAVGMSRAFGLTIAELAETDTISEEVLTIIRAFRTLPVAEQKLIAFLVGSFAHTHEEHKSERNINVMIPQCNCNGNLKETFDYELLNIDQIGDELIHRVFMGIQIPCEHYLPHYMQGQVLLLANDRDAIGSENTVIKVNDNLIITHRVVKNGKAEYYGIRDGVLRSEEDDRIFIVGYIAKTIKAENVKWVKK